MTTKDPSRDPELTHHYVSHALVNARFTFDLGKFPERAEESRKKLISKLEMLDNTGSKTHYELSRKCLDYLNQFGEWKTSEEVEKFAEKYKGLESEMTGPNLVKEFVEKHFPK
ncbi:MAG: hypothetical protein KKF67_00070 [Nanoarchaeota archaeon]|nr:hypothetical protein [Nanoarchaeota archaeon]